MVRIEIVLQFQLGGGGQGRLSEKGDTAEKGRIRRRQLGGSRKGKEQVQRPWGGTVPGLFEGE